MSIPMGACFAYKFQDPYIHLNTFLFSKDARLWICCHHLNKIVINRGTKNISLNFEYDLHDACVKLSDVKETRAAK